METRYLIYSICSLFIQIFFFICSEFDWYWFIMQISMLKNSCKLALKELKQWMMPEKVPSFSLRLSRRM